MAVGPESCHARTYITFLLKKKLQFKNVCVFLRFLQGHY